MSSCTGCSNNRPPVQPINVQNNGNVSGQNPQNRPNVPYAPYLQRIIDQQAVNQQNQPVNPQVGNPQVVHQNNQAVGGRLKWNERAIRRLDGWEAYLDVKMPNLPIQNKLDQLGRWIESKFAPLKEFNEWLDSNVEGKWYKRLADLLVKLPARVVRDIIRQLYNIVKSALYACVHPLKASVKLAKMIVNLVHSLTIPENWSRMGAGLMGASFGQSIMVPNPASAIGFLIGGAMLLGGLSVGAVKAAIDARENRFEAAGQNILSQLKELPEVAVSGLCMGLITGGIARAANLVHGPRYVVRR